jgi:hypothetical protein
MSPDADPIQWSGLGRSCGQRQVKADSERLQALCDIVHAGENDVGRAEVASVGGRIEVSLDHLFG